MLTSGRTAMLRECRAAGSETQNSSRSPDGACHTGVAHGMPCSSAVAIVM
jgi:hypothetical protein